METFDAPSSINCTSDATQRCKMYAGQDSCASRYHGVMSEGNE